MGKKLALVAAAAVVAVDAAAYSQNNVCWLRGYLIILKLLAGIEMVARPVTFEMVANDAAVTFGVTLFAMAFGPMALPTTVKKGTKTVKNCGMSK